VPFAGGKGENIAIVLGEGRMLPELRTGLDRRRSRREPGDRRGFSRRLPRRGTRRQDASVQDPRASVEEPSAAGSRRGVLQGVRRHRGRHAETARGSGRQHAPRTRSDAAQSQQDRGDGQAAAGESRRRAERADRIADTRHADRRDAPHRAPRIASQAPAREPSWSRPGAARRSG
jgi:hypothetical protein